MGHMPSNWIITRALVRILKNQVEIKVHLGIAKDDSEYGDCFYDHRMISQLECED